MAYEVIVSRVIEGDVASQELYRQSVDELDLKKIIAAVNSKPRKPRTPRTAPALKT